MKIKPRIFKGTRDFLPSAMIKRKWVIERISKIYEMYGFEPLDTPAIEYYEILGGKYGEEGEKLIYRFKDPGNRDVGLRYDLTVPLARLVAMHPEIKYPFKRYQIAPVWRADSPQKGRFREFYQCDIDTVGAKDLLADAEVLRVITHILEALNFNNYTVLLNSRKIIKAIAELARVDDEKELARILDKRDKIGDEKVLELLRKKDMKDAEVYVEHIIEGNYDDLDSSPYGEEGLNEINKVLHLAQKLGIKESGVRFEPLLARGLDYYTGPIFEVIVEEPKIGSIASGGRYDNLIGVFSKRAYPATGGSFGLERVLLVMEELGLFPFEKLSKVQILVSWFNKNDWNYMFPVVKSLRERGYNVSFYLGKSGFRGQLGYARDKHIPYVLFAGEEESKKGVFVIKDMARKEQKIVTKEELFAFLKDINV